MNMHNKKIHNSIKALANQIRIDILDYLMSGEKCVCEIFDHLELPQNLTSHHLGILKKNELILAKKEGKWVYYYLNQIRFGEIEQFIKSFSSAKIPHKSHKC